MVGWRGGRKRFSMDGGGRKRKIETRGAEAAEEEQRKKLQAKLGKVHCNYCKRDVSDQMYIKSGVIQLPPRLHRHAISQFLNPLPRGYLSLPPHHFNNPALCLT